MMRKEDTITGSTGTMSMQPNPEPLAVVWSQGVSSNQSPRANPESCVHQCPPFTTTSGKYSIEFASRQTAQYLVWMSLLCLGAQLLRYIVYMSTKSQSLKNPLRALLLVCVSAQMPVFTSYGLTSRDFLDPVTGNTLKDEIHCYGLPYGGLGFASHMLSVYTIYALAHGRKPLWPWSTVQFAFWSIALSVIGFVGAMTVTVFAMVGCRNTWQLVLLALWKMGMSIYNGIVAINVAFSVVHDDEEVDTETTVQSLKYVMLYTPFGVLGFIGLLSLVSKHWSSKIRILTMVFVVIEVSFVILAFVANERTSKLGYTAIGALLFFSTAILGIMALYADWALALMVDNLSGVADGDKAILSWLYFGLKRLAMFSF